MSDRAYPVRVRMVGVYLAVIGGLTILETAGGGRDETGLLIYGCIELVGGIALTLERRWAWVIALVAGAASLKAGMFLIINHASLSLIGWGVVTLVVGVLLVAGLITRPSLEWLLNRQKRTPVEF